VKIQTKGTYTEVAGLVFKTDPLLSLYHQSSVLDAPYNVFQAIMAYPKTATATHRLYEKGQPTTLPCAYTLTVFAAYVFAKWPDATLWLSKMELDKSTFGHKLKALKAKLEAKYVCKDCSVFSGLTTGPEPLAYKPETGLAPKPLDSVSVTWVTEAPLPKSKTPKEPHKTKAKVKVVKGKYHAGAINAPAIVSGTGTPDHWKTHRRDMEAIISGLYVMEELNMLVDPDAVPETVWTQFLMDRKTYQTRLARNLFDYLAIAGMGEARHWKGNNTIPTNRHEAWCYSLKYDPRSFLPVLSKLFHDGVWGHGSFGGSKWGLIADGAAFYFKYLDKPLLFSDHVVDLSHNGGPAFNKGIILTSQSWASYIAMLNRKRDGSLVEGHHTLILPFEVGLWFKMFQCLKALVIDQEPVIELRNDPIMPPMGWGTQQFTLKALEDTDHGVPIVSSPVLGNDHPGNVEAWPIPRTE